MCQNPQDPRLGDNFNMPLFPLRIMSGLVTGRILKKYGLQHEITKILHLSRKKKTLADAEGKIKYRSLCYRLQENVHEFLTRDENSRLTAGKAQTIMRGKKKNRKGF